MTKSIQQFIVEKCKNKRVLDIGCGSHDISKSSKWLHKEIAKTAKYLVGIDIDQHRVEKMNNKGYVTYLANAQNFDLRKLQSEPFDLIVCDSLIDQVINPGCIIKCALKHLSNDGKMIFTTSKKNLYDFSNIMLNDKDSINKFFKLCGCSVVEIKEFCNVEFKLVFPTMNKQFAIIVKQI